MMKTTRTFAAGLATLIGTMGLLNSVEAAGLTKTAGPARCEGFLPKNSMRIPVDSKAAGGLTQSQFNAVLDKLDRLYRAEIKGRGGDLSINRNWKTAEVNAYADREGDKWVIYMFGGLARHRAVTTDAFALVACHELGHHLGGAPKFSGNENEWASNEGEADYYAALKCLRRYFDGDDNEKILAKMAVDPAVKATCEREHRNREDQRQCMRASMAGASLGTLLMELNQDGPIRFTTPDPKVVAKMDDSHPASQCRLDTYFHGALCDVPVVQTLDDSDYHAGSCTQDNDQGPGFRPQCWFKP